MRFDVNKTLEGVFKSIDKIHSKPKNAKAFSRLLRKQEQMYLLYAMISESRRTRTREEIIKGVFEKVRLGEGCKHRNCLLKERS